MCTDIGPLCPFLGVKDTLCDVRSLRPGTDYKFRIRVENKHGTSEPSPYTTAHRSKIYEKPKVQEFLPKDYEIEHPPLHKYGNASEYLFFNLLLVIMNNLFWR